METKHEDHRWLGVPGDSETGLDRENAFAVRRAREPDGYWEPGVKAEAWDQEGHPPNPTKGARRWSESIFPRSSLYVGGQVEQMTEGTTAESGEQ